MAILAVVALGVHLLVVFYEEPTLRGRFAAEYQEYCRNVRRWSRCCGVGTSPQGPIPEPHGGATGRGKLRMTT
jgi:hypothetical protein